MQLQLPPEEGTPKQRQLRRRSLIRRRFFDLLKPAPITQDFWDGVTTQWSGAPL